jgi:(2Fe-2S) ferredoxin/predicted O-methyltransferase YrrM
MEPFRFHVYACTQEKPEGVPCCTQRGSLKMLEALRRELAAQGLMNDVQVTTSGSLGLCESGPNLIVYPEGIWYSNVQPEDVPEIVRSHFKEDTPVQRLMRTDAAALRAEHLQNRDRYLASLKARDTAGQLPDDLLAKIRGFQESRAILTALELNLFTAIGQGAAAAEVARRLNTAARSTEMLLNALAAMELLYKSDGKFSNSPVAARFFTDSSPDNTRPAMMHMVNMWTRWSTLTEAVRAGTSVIERRAWSQESAHAFISCMDHNARERAPHILRTVGAERVRRILDLGGGSGAYSIAFARANPQVRAEILDLPEILELTSRYIQQARLSDRVTTRPGDMLTADFGQGYDLVLLFAICHMFSEQQNQVLFKRAHAALAPGGRLVVQDFILEPNKISPRIAALFSLNMLVGTTSGASYSAPEYETWLRSAGFTEVARVPLPGPSGLMIGTK